MTRSFTALAFVLALSAPVVATAAPAPDIATRYAAAWQYVRAGALVTDIDLAPVYVDGGKGVVFRRGAVNQQRVIYADALTGAEQELTNAPTLKAKLPTDVTGDIRPTAYDAVARLLKLTVGGKPFSLNLATGTIEAIAPEPKMEGVVSPDGKRKVISRNYNLYVIDLVTGAETALTTDGVYDQRYGTNYPLLGDMAAANSETPDMPVAVNWSPDSKSILTYRLVRNGSYIWHAVQQTPPGSRFPREFTYVYPTAGAKNVPQFQPVLIDVATAKVRDLGVPALDMLWPGDPPLWWEGDHILYEWTKRGYGEVDLMEIDPVTGIPVTRVREAMKPLVTVTSSGRQSAPELGGYLNLSERSGWEQLYFVKKGEDPNGGRALTKGEWEVSQIVRVADNGPVWVIGNGREKGINPYYNSLYKVGMDGAIVNLTPEPLDHNVMLADDGKTFVDRMSDVTHPTLILLRDLGDGHVIATLGQADPAALLATGFTPPEPFHTLADDGKTMLYGTIFRPKNFDPSRTYPVIDYVYTGPTTHNSDTTYREALSSVNAMAQIGAIVVEIDGRGTSQRGKAFRDPAYQNMGEVGIDDHIWVLKAMQKQYPYFDLNRVGVYGHSAGGYDTARFVLRRPDFYKVGVASSGNQDLRLDKAWWPEVTMGLADDATWERNSNVSVAGNLKGKLMLMHGDIDDNVPIAATMALDKALIDAGKPHDLVIFPNRTHDTYTPYFWRLHFDYFTINLLGEAPPPAP